MPEGITLKRIIDMDETEQLSSSDYVLVDSASGGNRKYKLGEDLNNLKDDFESLQTDLAQTTAEALSAYVTDTATGAIASFPDGADGVPVKSLTVDIEPVQDLHGQDAPYPAGGNGNLLPPLADGTYTGNGVTAVVKDGVITLSGTTESTGNALIIPFTETVTIPSKTCYLHLMNSAINGSLSPSFELSTDVENTGWSLAAISKNRVAEIANSKHGVTWNRVRFYITSGITLSGTIAPMIMTTSDEQSAYIPYSNICPISGHTQAVVTRCGKNLLDALAIVASSGHTDHVYINDGYLMFKTGDVSVMGLNWTGLKIPTPVACTLSIKNFTSFESPVIIRCQFTDGTNAVIYNHTLADHEEVKKTVVLPEGKTISRIYNVWTNAINTGINLAESMLELGSTATVYEPYNGQTVTIDLGGTIYGGTLDVTTGVLTVDRTMFDMGSRAWSKANTVSGKYRFLAYLGVVDGAPVDTVANIVCSTYPAITANQTWEGTKTGVALSSVGLHTILVCDMSFEDADTFKQAMNGVQCVVQLSAPRTIQLTAQEVRTLLGQNNVFADCGDVSVEYRADTKLYIEKLTAPTEDDMIADHAISANSFFMIGNTLYRATTAIASGATITVGTNATKLSLSDALNALS